MAATTFTVNNGTVTTGTRAYTKQLESAKGASYIDTSTSLAQPRMLEVTHDLKAPGADGNDRHQVMVRYTKINAQGKVRHLSASVVLSVPRDACFTDADVLDVVVNGTSFLTEARISALADGIVPNA